MRERQGPSLQAGQATANKPAFLPSRGPRSPSPHEDTEAYPPECTCPDHPLAWPMLKVSLLLGRESRD